MRRMLSSYFAGLALLFSSNAGAADAAKTTLTIKGMTCGGCVAAVKLQLRKTDGVAAYDVSLEKGEAEVTYDPAARRARAARLVQCFERVGPGHLSALAHVSRLPGRARSAQNGL